MFSFVRRCCWGRSDPCLQFAKLLFENGDTFFGADDRTHGFPLRDTLNRVFLFEPVNLDTHCFDCLHKFVHTGENFIVEMRRSRNTSDGGRL